ncbi:MAG: hypothetical protein RLZ55_1422 [Actinomycetota bacterium]
MPPLDRGEPLRYRLFDRVLFSPVGLPLLAELSDDTPVPRSPGDQVVVEWTEGSGSTAPLSRITIGHPSGFEVFRTADGYDFTSIRGGWTATVDPAGRHVQVRLGRGMQQPAARSVADDLTTAILTRLPALWGLVPLHAAVVLGPAGVVVLCGPSGAGKSTLGHCLARRAGWHLVDDDTVILEPADSDGSMMDCWAMGSTPRLRSDAAAGLGVQGRAILGFADGKIAADTPRIGSVRGFTSAVVIHLRPIPPETDEATTANIEFTRVRPAAAMSLLGKSAFSVDLRDRRWLARRFQFSRGMAAHPTFTLEYSPGVVGPEALSEHVVGAVQGAWAAPRISEQPGPAPRH